MTFSPSAIPTVIDLLLANAADALVAAGVTDIVVCDGMGLDGSGADQLLVGAADPFSDAFSETARSTSEWANPQERDETGWVNCQAYAWNGSSGDVGQAAARARVYAIAGAIADWARVNRLNVPTPLLWIGFGEGTEFLQVQDEQGSAARLTFSVGFRARL